MPQRILIADDNPTFRKALRQLLQGVDHWEIIEAAEGQEAVTKSVETRPDLVLLDLAMPVKDGFAAAREISQLLPGTPILMCTMHSSSHVETEAQKSGIRQVLSKTNSTLILPAIQQWLTPPESPIQDSSAAPVSIVVPDPTVPENVVSRTSAAEPAAEVPNGLLKNVA
jgi:CheY-like chemotaxis protein